MHSEIRKNSKVNGFANQAIWLSSDKQKNLHPQGQNGWASNFLSCTKNTCYIELKEKEKLNFNLIDYLRLRRR